MTWIVVSVVWAGALCWLGHKAMQLADKHMADARNAAAEEHELQRHHELALAKASAPATPVQKIPLPPNLDAIATQESEPWARDQMRDALRDLYAEHGDWDKVVTALGGAF